MPIWTNVFSLPGPLVEVIEHDLYTKTRQAQLNKYKSDHELPLETPHFSVSDLIKPPRMRTLINRHYDEIVKDVSGDIFRLLGQLFHHLFRDSAMRANKAGGDYVAEERMFTHIVFNDETVIISGEPDLVKDGVLDDYKVTGIYGWDKGIKIEWEQQLNCYRWLRSCNGLATKELRAVYILRDWKKSESMQEGYPAAAAMTMPVTMWPLEQAERFVLDRLKTHQDARGATDEALPECSPLETWEKPEGWAVKKEGNKVASKVWNQEKFPEPVTGEFLRLAAEADAVARAAKTKGKGVFFVEHRPGSRTRCESYCDAKSWCSQFREYASAAYRGRPQGEDHDA